MLNLFLAWVLWHFVFPLVGFLILLFLICAAFVVGGFVKAARIRRREG